MSHPITLAEGRQIAHRVMQEAKAERAREREAEAKLYEDSTMSKSKSTASELAVKAALKRESDSRSEWTYVFEEQTKEQVWQDRKILATELRRLGKLESTVQTIARRYGWSEAQSKPELCFVDEELRRLAQLEERR